MQIMYPSVQRTPDFYSQGNFQRHSYDWRPNFQQNVNYQGTNYNNENNYDNHWCETCDRGFPTSQQLEKHKLQHQKCNIDGCQFIAHPKVITKHIQMQHSSGLFKKISKLNNPEDIKKWIEERKKKYPTKQNIEKKSAELKEKIQRGERMGLQSKGRHKFNSSDNTLKRKHSFSSQNNQYNKKPMKNNGMQKFKNSKGQVQTASRSNTNRSAQIKAKEVPVIQADDNRKLKPFAGIQDMDMESDKDEVIPEVDNVPIIDDDDQHTDDNTHTLEKPNSTVCNALSALISNYESEEEIDNEEKKSQLSRPNNSYEVKSVCEDKPPPTVISDDIRTVIYNNDDRTTTTTPTPYDNHDSDDGSPEEVKVVKHDLEPCMQNETIVEQNNHRTGTIKSSTDNRKKPVFYKPKPKLPSTLLQKLLRREMQHERNIVLQCVRHIINKNFFDEQKM